MAAMSDYLRQALINHTFRDTTFTPPAVIALALCTSTPVDSDTGDLTGKEVVGSSYARVSIGRGDAVWTSGTTTLNADVIVWPTATGTWTGPITHVAVVDNTTIGDGNLLFYGALSVPKTITSGDVFLFNVNQLAIRMG